MDKHYLMTGGEMDTSVAIIGGGKVGTAMGKQLAAAGYRMVGVCCRTETSARRAASVINAEKIAVIPWEITPLAQIVFITTPDGDIARVYGAIMEHDGFAPGTTVLHCSGALPSTVLTAPGDSHIHKGSLHPLQSFAAADLPGNPFQGIIAAIEGDERALAVARQVGESMGATCFTIKTEAKVLYHAAAAVASNYLVTIIDIAFSFLESAGINRKDAVTILFPLIQGTLSNIRDIGIPQALTGPIARGDLETIKRHLEQIGTHHPDLSPVYGRLGLQTIRLAQGKGSLSPSLAEELRRLLLTGIGS